MIVCKPFQPSDNFIIRCIAEFLAASFTDFLESVNDDELCVGMLSYKTF